jgi:syntaxin of plants SYP5
MADSWVSDYQTAKEVANDVLSLINERNLKYPGGGPESSRITAAARRKLATLASLLDGLRTTLETSDTNMYVTNLGKVEVKHVLGARRHSAPRNFFKPLCTFNPLHFRFAHHTASSTTCLCCSTENEKNRRRDLLAALRSRREQMLQALKRDQQPQKSSRSALLGGVDGTTSSVPRETDATAELNNRGLISMQQQVMHQQDTELEHLERSVVTTKHVALQINEETQLHNRLLDELDVEVGASADRLAMAQRKLKVVMRRASGCRTQLLVFLLLVVLVVVVVIGFKIAIRFA